tara:strand:- start:300 stop:455 length:156 start_codon:yes stop_codon:yes gene_type:complete
MKDKNIDLPLRSGVGIVVLNKKDQVFVAKRIDNNKISGKCLKVALIKVKII